VKRRIVLLGPPASGKGTQSELIQKIFQIPATSTGAILRREAKLNSAIGREADRIISKGALAPDELVSLGHHVQSASDPCPNCGGKLEIRSDDNQAALTMRLEEFRKKSLPLIDFYSERDLLATVDADQEVDKVFDQISRVIRA
jgi:adenylate kinase